MPSKKEDLPGTLQRSPEKVQRTYEETLDSAHETYKGDERRAHRTAYAAVKHIAEKRGDHWELKDEPGPSAAGRGAARNGSPIVSGQDVAAHASAAGRSPTSWRRTYCRIPPWRKYSASFGVSIRTRASNWTSPARTVTVRGSSPAFSASASPVIENSSSPVRPSASALW